MPQMSPLMWLPLFFFYVLCLQHISTLIYFYVSPKTKFFSLLLIYNNSKMSWMW